MGKNGKTALVILLGIALLWFFLANPLNLFLRRSEYFSMLKFQSTKPGTDVTDAIAVLGKPIAIVKSKYDFGCRGCVAYYFMGDPPPWLLCYQEAWLLTDSQGRILEVTVNSEP
jgi:hypothetical protein